MPWLGCLQVERISKFAHNNEHIEQASFGGFAPAGCVFYSYVSSCGDADPADQLWNTRGRQRRYRIPHWLPVQSDKSTGCTVNCHRVQLSNNGNKITFYWFLFIVKVWNNAATKIFTLCLSVKVKSWPFPPITTSTKTCSRIHLWSHSLMLVGGAQMSEQHKIYFTFF